MSSLVQGRFSLTAWLPALLLLAIGVIAALYSLFLPPTADELTLFVALNASLAIYLGLESARLAYRYGRTALLMAPVLASILHFLLSYILPSLASLLSPYIRERYFFFVGASDYMEWVNYTSLLVWAAAFCMWRGHDVGRRMGLRLAGLLRRSGWFRPNFKPHLPVVIALGCASVVAVLVMIRLGVYGYSLDPKAAQEHVAYLSYLKLVANAGFLALLLLSIKVFTDLKAGHARLPILVLAAVFLVFQLFAGFLSGFKGMVLLPVIVMAIAYYVVYLKIRYYFLGIAFLAIFAAYQVIEPFRVLRYQDSSFDPTSISSIVATLYKGTTMRTSQGSGTLEKLALRSDLLGFSAAGIRYAHHVELDSSAPQFAKSILLAPMYAYVPRLIWPDKPKPATGNWFYKNVLGRPFWSETSVGMGPVAYLYFAAGIPAVLLGFFFLGVLQRVVFEGLTGAGAGGWLVYLMVVERLVIIYSDFGPMLAGFLQLLPFAVITQYLVLRR